MKKKQLKAELKDAQKALEISNETIKIQVDKVDELRQQLSASQANLSMASEKIANMGNYLEINIIENGIIDNLKDELDDLKTQKKYLMKLCEYSIEFDN